LQQLIIVCFDARIVQFVFCTMMDVLQFDMEQSVRGGADPKIHVLQIEQSTCGLVTTKKITPGTP
jgi:hypothetical protein